jgi:hypothetical protein
VRLKVGVFARRGPATKARSAERRGFGASFCRYRILTKIVIIEHIIIVKVTESRPNCGAASSRRSECFNEELREHETVFVLSSAVKPVKRPATRAVPLADHA